MQVDAGNDTATPPSTPDDDASLRGLWRMSRVAVEVMFGGLALFVILALAAVFARQGVLGAAAMIAMSVSLLANAFIAGLRAWIVFRWRGGIGAEPAERPRRVVVGVTTQLLLAAILVVAAVYLATASTAWL